MRCGTRLALQSGEPTFPCETHLSHHSPFRDTVRHALKRCASTGSKRRPGKTPGPRQRSAGAAIPNRREPNQNRRETRGPGRNPARRANLFQQEPLIHSMRRQLFSISIFAAMSIFAAKAQSPAPIVVPALSPAIVSTTPKAAPVIDSDSLPLTIKVLQEMKAANEEMLKKQEAALQQLEELQKAADEIKVFSKRS